MYNIEKYIAYCVESCIHQQDVTPDDFEIIIVNDGATDNSLQVAQEAIKGIVNARIVTRSNGGLSEARNTGIENSRGEYLWFVDGDDAIAEKAISTLINYIDRYKCDGYLINFSTFETKEKIETSNLDRYHEPISGQDIHFKHNDILPLMAWLTIYKTDVIKKNHLTFMPGIVHEDMEFSIRSHHLCSSILMLKEDLYMYRVARNDSIMSDSHKDNTKSLVATIKIIETYKTFFANVNNAFTRHLFGMLSTSFLIRRYDKAFVDNETTKHLKKTYKTQLYKDMWCSHEWKRMCLLLFILSMPPTIISKVLYKLGERSKLM